MYPFKVSTSESLGCPYAAVEVRRKGNRFVIQEGVFIVKPDAYFTPLPSEYIVEGKNGDIAEASGRFLISTETLDPVHVMVDWKGPFPPTLNKWDQA